MSFNIHFYAGPVIITEASLRFDSEKDFDEALLPTSIQNHIEECQLCRTLLEHAYPDPIRLEQVVEQVRADAFSDFSDQRVNQSPTQRIIGNLFWVIVGVAIGMSLRSGLL